VVKITVPATTANLGPGFDCIGAALTLYNRFEFTPAAAFQIDVRGDGQELVSQGTDNLVYQAFCRLYGEIDQTPPPIHLMIQMGIPLARGLGSSATAIVGGLMGANELAGRPLDTSALINLATQIEGHPDNVVPALLGGCHLAAKDGDD
jgi:homoserine kinase